MPQLVLNVKTEKKENSKESRMIKANVFVKKVYFLVNPLHCQPNHEINIKN